MNQKLENILNVSLDATEDELRKADSLSTGYNWRDNTWEIIVKYSGSLESIRNRYNVYIKELLNYYAIIVADNNRTYIAGRCHRLCGKAQESLLSDRTH